MREATIRQATVLVGGLGSRLGALTAETPKPLLEVGGRPFLVWLLRELVRFGVEDILLLTGHLSERVEAALAGLVAHLPKRVTLGISREPRRAGTGGALFYARDRLQPHFLLCNGDSLLDLNLAHLLAEAAADPDEVVGRIVLRSLPDASRYGVVALEGDRVTEFRARPPAGTPGIINAGMYLFDRRVLASVREDASLEQDVLPALAERGALRGTPANGYFIDIGIPEDLARARAELASHLSRPALFLDRDGVINRDHGWVGTRERFEWMPGAIEAIRAASDDGWHVFVVTNQSGVARGHYDEAAVAALHGWMVEQIRRQGGNVDDIRYCPFHPEAPLERYRQAHGWRKPEPGMILDLIACWGLDRRRCVLVGDQETDLAAAAAAGIAARRFTGGDVRACVAEARAALTRSMTA
jgi:D,D-heptose 1,7-bisphosphate phosphatase